MELNVKVGYMILRPGLFHKFDCELYDYCCGFRRCLKRLMKVWDTGIAGFLGVSATHP